MKDTRNKTIIILFLLLACGAGLTVWLSAGGLATTTVTSEDGTWDLRGTNFAEESVVLAGDVEYVPNALLTPEGFDEAEQRTTGEIPSITTYLTSRVRLLVPEGSSLEIAGFADDFGSRIYVNGTWILDSGKPAETEAESIPAKRLVSFTVEPVDGVIEIVQQSSNFVFRSNSSHHEWTIGLPEQIERWEISIHYTAIINMGVYLALFFVHLLLFILLSRYRANLWLALLCLTLFVRAGITGAQPLVTLLSIPWEPMLRMEYITALGGLVFITLAYSEIFGAALSQKLCRVVYVLAGAFLLVFLFADTLFASWAIIVCELVSCLWAAYAVIRILMHLKKADIKQKILVAGLALILFAMIWDTLYHNVGLTFMLGSFIEVGVMVFLLFQITAMLLGTMEEVAAAREAEQRLALENASLDRMNRLKSDLMSTISHEARTPLAVLSSYAGIVSMELARKDTGKEIAADLDKIVSEAKRVATLIDSMKRLTMGATTQTEKTAVDIGELASETARLYRPLLERDGIVLEVHIKGELLVWGVPEELTQLLFNILQNAREHTNQGAVVINGALDEDVVTVSLADTGTGVPSTLLPHIFEKGITSKEGGSGLGLPICQEIIQAHGGTIQIANREEGGAIVTLKLPAHGAERESVSSMPPREEL